MAKTNNKGFTLIEIVIAVAILSVLLTPILKQYPGDKPEGKSSPGGK